MPSRAGDSVTGRDLLHLLKHLSMISKAITEIRTNLRNKNKIVEFPWQGAKNSAGVSFALGVPSLPRTKVNCKLARHAKRANPVYVNRHLQSIRRRVAFLLPRYDSPLVRSLGGGGGGTSGTSALASVLGQNTVMCRKLKFYSVP